MIINEFNVEPWIIMLLILLTGVYYMLWFSKEKSHVQVHYNRSCHVVQTILNRCLSLEAGYEPTFLWGKNGHIQSFLFSIFGRIGKSKGLVENSRNETFAKDGSVVTYDVFRTNNHCEGYILVIPGICNHAENTYIRVFATHLCSLNYNVVVFNHTGALKSVKLRKGKIFTYGQTDDLQCVVDDVLQKENIHKFSAAIGFSLGANILMKFLGENCLRQQLFQCAASLCQGYDIPECNIYFNQWENFRRFYNYMLTRNMLRVIHNHKDVLDQHLDLNWTRVSSASSLHQLDQAFTIKITEEKTIEEFYLKSSSSQYMKNIDIPLLILNAKDDPLIPESLYHHPKKLIDTNPNVLFVVTRYGGHLGFFEGGIFIPNHLSWLDRFLGEYIQAAGMVKQS